MWRSLISTTMKVRERASYRINIPRSFVSKGKRVFWHSSAHILGEAAERRFGCHLCIGPPTDEGFYYEMGMGLTDRNILESDIQPLEDLSKTVIKEKQKFERLVLPKETLLEMFKVRVYSSLSTRSRLILIKIFFIV